MRKTLSIAKTTALEIFSEPLSLLLLLAALAMAVLAPALHYHQFGDPTRMARDAGFSAILTCGGLMAVFCTIRAFRNEIETGTLEMALAHPVSRTGFFLAKTLGAALAYLAFALTVLGTTAVMVTGAAVGGEIARRTGDIARIFGPCLATGTGIILLPLGLAALLNRFCGFRFVRTAFALAFGLSLAAALALAVLFRTDAARLLPPAATLALLAILLLSAAAAFSVRLKANAAASAVGVVFVLLLPAVGNYCTTDALGGAGTPAWGYVALAGAVTLPAVAAFLLLGVHFINGRDIQWTA